MQNIDYSQEKKANINRWVIGLWFFASILFIKCQYNAPVPYIHYSAHPIADSIFQIALNKSDNSDPDSTIQAISWIDKAILIDSLNPEYYGVKAKLLSEMGMLDSALAVQEKALELGAINGEFYFQLGLFQFVKERHKEAKLNFKNCVIYQDQLLQAHPDSLGGYFIRQAAHSLLHENDDLFMEDIKLVRELFPDRLLEIQFMRRFKPSQLLDQIKKAQEIGS